MHTSSDRGFSLLELLVSTCVLLLIMGVVMTAMRQQTQQQQTIWNRTEMHSGVRGATELMQQEIGQAGRVAAPVKITLSQAVGVVCDLTVPALSIPQTVQVNSVAGLWVAGGVSSMVTTLDGGGRETVQLLGMNPGVNPPTITACFGQTHAVGTTISVEGAFGNGIIP